MTAEGGTNGGLVCMRIPASFVNHRSVLCRRLSIQGSIPAFAADFGVARHRKHPHNADRADARDKANHLKRIISMTSERDLWSYDHLGRWTKIAATASPAPTELEDDHTDEDPEDAEMPYFDDREAAPLWVISVNEDGTFSLAESDRLLTNRKEPFAFLRDAMEFCDAIDLETQYGDSLRKQTNSVPATPTAAEPSTKAPSPPLVLISKPTSQPGGTLTAYYSDDNCTIYNADCRDILPSLDRFDLLLTKPPQYEFGLSDDNKTRMDSGSRLAPQTNRISPLPEAELLMAISKAANAIVWSPSRYRLPEGKQLEWCCRKLHFARAWHNIAVPRMMNWGDVPESDRTRLLIQCIHIAPTANTVLDPFMGTGDVLIAASRLRRTFVGIEIDKQRCDQAVNRLLELKKPR
jgi:site-specific DNA-methyltransferase (adenine-specific)